MPDQKPVREPEPRWPAIVATLSVGMLFYAMPESLTVGPGWLVLVLVGLLLIPTTVSYRIGRGDLNEIFAYTNLGVITLAVLSSLVLLVTEAARAQGIACGVAARGGGAVGQQRSGFRIVVLATRWRRTE